MTRDQVIAKYGPIKYWDVSEVTNMKRLFGVDYIAKFFNEDISLWDTSSVLNMESSK